MEIEQVEVNYLYGGGYYLLRQVANDMEGAPPGLYCDIYMLIENHE